MKRPTFLRAIDLTLISTLLTALAGCPLLSGCATSLNGSGEAGIGYRSETKVFLYHSTDGDKNDAKANSKLESQPLENWIEGTTSEPEELPQLQ